MAGDSGAAACLKAFIVCKILDLHVFACHKSGKKKEHRGEKIYNKMCLHVYVKRAKKECDRLRIRNVCQLLCDTMIGKTASNIFPNFSNSRVKAVVKVESACFVQLNLSRP